MRFTLFLPLLSFLILSCDESLPTRSDPDEIIDVYFSRVNTATLQPIVEPDSYFWWLPEGLDFGFRLTDVYDDPLEAPIHLIMHLTFTPDEAPQYAHTMTIVDTSGLEFRLDKNVPRWFHARWTFDINRDGTPVKLWTLLSGKWTEDRVYKKYAFTVTGDIQIYRQIAPASGNPYRFTLYIRP